jgi:hypothetical protein
MDVLFEQLLARAELSDSDKRMATLRYCEEWTLRHARLDMTMYYAHSRKKRSWRPKVECWKRFLGVNGGYNGGWRQNSSKIVDWELVYNDELTATKWALNSAVECHLHTVEVIGSNPIAPTNNQLTLRTLRRRATPKMSRNVQLAHLCNFPIGDHHTHNVAIISRSAGVSVCGPVSNTCTRSIRGWWFRG